MKILITGGAGFIGSRTALRLAQAGHDLVVVDSFDPQIHGWNLAESPGFKALDGVASVTAHDALKLADDEKLWDGVEAVYHFASSTGTGQSMYAIQDYVRNNVSVAAVVAEQLLKRRERIKRVVLSGTRAIYGEGAGNCGAHGRVFAAKRSAREMSSGIFAALCPVCGGEIEPLPSLESDPSAPSSVYATTKLAQEQLIRGACEAAGIPSVFFRYQNVYGPGQSLKNPYTGILSIFAGLIRTGSEINVFEDGAPSRDFVFIDDVVEYNARALECELEGQIVLNLGAGVRKSIVDVVQALGLAMGRQPRHRVTGDFRVGDIRHACADTALLTRTLGPHQFKHFEDGVAEFVKWAFREEPDAQANSRYSDSLAEMARAGLLQGASGK